MMVLFILLSGALAPLFLLSAADALPACPGQTFYLKSGEALEIKFNRRPGCDVRFVTVERGVVDRKLFYPSGKTDERRLSARERDIPEAWSELPQKAYLKASSETVIKFLAQTPPPAVQEKSPQEVCPAMVLMLSPGEEEVIRLGRRPGCTVMWTNYEGTVEEFITYPSGKTERRVIRPGMTDFKYAEWPSSVRVKGVTKATLKFFAQKPAPVQKPSPALAMQPQAPRSQPPTPRRQTKRQADRAQFASELSFNDLVDRFLFFVLACGIIYLLIRLAKSSSIFVLGHWSKLIENLEASPMEFYTSVENAIQKREVPSIRNCRIDWKEGGLFTAWREYLRISREKEVVDICAAPYGTGFFISWWHGESRPGAVGPTIVAIGIFFVIDSISRALLRYPTSILTTALAILVIVLFLGILISRSAGQNWIRYVLAIPVIGWLMDRLFLPPTYYRIDSASMFRAAIEQAVHEVIDQMAEAKGLRALTELERKPILRDFFQKLR